MARLVWTHRATNDLNEIAAFISLDDENAAFRLVARLYAHVEQLIEHPMSGSVPIELEGREYRQIVEPPCRIFYKIKDDTVYIVHVIRSERILRMSRFDDSD